MEPTLVGDTGRGAMRKLLAITSLCALALLAACGDDDGDSAAERTCEARDDVKSAVDSVRDDIESGNFGDAEDSMEQVRSSFDELQSSLQDLGEEQRQALQPEIDAVQSDVQALGDITSLDQLSTAMQGLESDVQALFDAARDDLDCS
jgi:hypothetical protein